MKYIMITSSKVSLSKSREFEQTIQFIFNHLPPGNEKHFLSLDVHDPSFYHTVIVWQSEDAFNSFKSSNECQVMNGAFQTLGVKSKTIEGKWVDVHAF